jgi:hypothetical protein
MFGAPLNYGAVLFDRDAVGIKGLAPGVNSLTCVTTLEKGFAAYEEATPPVAIADGGC